MVLKKVSELMRLEVLSRVLVIGNRSPLGQRPFSCPTSTFSCPNGSGISPTHGQVLFLAPPREKKLRFES